MSEIVEKAFSDLLEKAKKGTKKVGNPMYRKVINAKGNTIYVLANKKDSVEFRPPSKLTEQEFQKRNEAGRADLVAEKPDTFEDLGNEVLKLEYLSEESRDAISRLIKRTKFFDSSIRVAKDMGNEAMYNGHVLGRQRLVDTINKAIADSKRGQFMREFESSIFSEAKNAFDLKGYSLEINGIDQSSIDFINENYSNFDFNEFCMDVLGSFESQKKKIKEDGIDERFWKPKLSIDFSGNGFEIKSKNTVDSTSDTKDKYGFKVDLKYVMRRSFSSYAGKKKVYHAIFKCGQEVTGNNEINVMRGGFAKSLMSGFAKQYEKAGLEKIEVNAASRYGTPFTGSNTWGRWGFRTIGKNIVDSAINSFKNPVFVATDEKVIEHENRNDIYIVKQQPKGVFVKIPIKTGEYEENGRNYKVTVVTKKDESTGLFKSKIYKETEILPSDARKLRSVFEKTKEGNGSNFRLKNFYEAFTGEGEADALRGMLYGIGWAGSVDLNDESQKKDFMDNVYKKYEKVPNSVYEYFNSTDETILKKEPKQS